MRVSAQVEVTSTGGTSSGSYTTLKTAVDSINRGYHQGVINIRVHANTIETATISLDSSGNLTGSSYTSILIRPADTATVVKSVSTSAAITLMVLSGADNVTFDGRPGGLGTAQLLEFSHTVSATTNFTCRFDLGATNNIIRFCRFLNASAASSAHNIWLTNAVLGSIANSNNTFLNNVIQGGRNGIVFDAVNGNAPITNILIRNNQFVNIGFAGVSNLNNLGQVVIDSNSFFHEAAFTSPGQARAISLGGLPATVSVNATITKNRIFGFKSSSTTIYGIIITPPATATGSLYNINNNSIAYLDANNTVNGGAIGGVNGITVTGTGSGEFNIFQNTIRIGGVAVGGTAATLTIRSVGVGKFNSGTANIFRMRNNIITNTRTGGASTQNAHMAVWINTTTAGTHDIDRNTYQGTTFVAGWGGTVFGAVAGGYQTAASPNEANSNLKTPTFLNNTQPYLTGASLGDIDLSAPIIGTVTTDIDNNTRSTLTYKGALQSAPFDTFDLQTLILYTYGKIPVGTDDTVRAVVRNLGTLPVVNQPVYLRSSINGIIGSVNVSIPSGGQSTVNLVPYTPFTLGNDTLTVNGDPDQKTANDTARWVRQNTLNALSYTNITTAQTGNVGTNPQGEIVAKFYTPFPNFLNQVNVNFTNAFFNGPFPFEIVIYEDSGSTFGPKFNPLWVSTTQNTINGIFNLPIPSILVTGNFYIGVRQTSANNIGFAFQNENPIRNRTFYFRQGATFQSLAWNDFAVNPNNQFRFMIEPRLSINDDLGVTDLKFPGLGCVNVGTQPVRFTVQNLGLLNQNFATDTLRLFGTITKPSGTVIPFGPILRTTGTLNAGDTTSILAFSSFNFDTVGNYTFRAWTTFTPDANGVNDTLPALVRNVSASASLPLVQNFDAVAFPASWLTNRFFVSTGSGTGGTNGLRVNINNTSPFAANASVTSPGISNISNRSVLRFDYKIINNLGGTSATLINTDSIKVLISTDCGNSFTMVNLINGQNHTPSTNFSTVSIPLNSYIGANITAKIVCDWFGTSNDAIVDIDNIRFINDSNDLRVTAINNPCKSIIQGSSAFAPQITVNNLGLNAQSSVPVSVQITGPVNYTGTGTITSIANSANAVVNLSTTFNPTTLGTYTVRAWVSLATDNDRFNDTIQATFNVVNTNLGDSALNAIQMLGAGNLFAPNASSLNITGNQISIEAWIRTTAFTVAKQTIVHKNDGTVKYALSLDSISNNLVFDLNTANGLVSAVSNTPVLPGAWRHVAATYDGSIITLYLNGREIGTSSQTGNIVSNTANLQVGRGLASNSFYEGQIDELKIWNIARTSLQIRNAMHTRSANASSVNLMAYYRFDEGGASQTVVDASGNCNALTLEGSALPTFVVSRLALGSPIVNSQTIFSTTPVAFTGTGLTLTLNGFSGQDTITVHRFSGLPKDSVPTGVSAVHNKYWIVYKYGNNSFTSTEASFNLGAGNLLSTVTPSELSLFNRANTSNLGWSLLSNPATSADFATQNVVFTTTSQTIFNNQWSIGGNNNPLPVRLISFVGNRADNAALLNWVTSSELNNAYFKVLRSVDGINFNQVGNNVKGAGTSNIKQSYTFENDITDIIKMGYGVVYYKLVQVDIDGKQNDLPIVSITLTDDYSNLDIMPNPFSDQIELLTVSAKQENASVVIVDMQGRVVLETKVNNVIGANSHIVNTESLSKGIYFIKVTSGDNLIVKKMLKK
jgi:hypothetical protein